MTTDKLKLLCNGVASIADATDTPFCDILDALEMAGHIEEEDIDAAIGYVENVDAHPRADEQTPSTTQSQTRPLGATACSLYPFCDECGGENPAVPPIRFVLRSGVKAFCSRECFTAQEKSLRAQQESELSLEIAHLAASQPDGSGLKRWEESKQRLRAWIRGLKSREQPSSDSAQESLP